MLVFDGALDPAKCRDGTQVVTAIGVRVRPDGRCEGWITYTQDGTSYRGASGFHEVVLTADSLVAAYEAFEELFAVHGVGLGI